MLKSCLNQISVNYQTIISDTAIGIGVHVELSLKTNYLVPSDLPADIIYKSVYIFNFFGLLHHSGSTHPLPSFSSVAVALCTSSFVTSMNFLCGLPLSLLPGSSNFKILYPMYQLSFLCTCPNHISLRFQTAQPELFL